MAPVFQFYDHFDATIQIGDRQMPVKVKRLTKADLEAFEAQWDRLVAKPRGTVDPEDGTPEAAALESARLQFFEESIAKAITLAPGLVRVNDVDIVDGEGVMSVFHARKDVQSSLMLAIYAKNRLTDLVKNGSSLLPASATGSEVRNTDGGGAPAPTAAPAGSSSTAPIADVTES